MKRISEENRIIEEDKKRTEEEELRGRFKNNIEHLLGKIKDKQGVYAKKIGITSSMLSEYKNGESYPSKFRILNNISKCFNISIDDLLNCDLKKRDKDKEHEEEIMLHNPYSGNNVLPFGNKLYDKFLSKDFWMYYFRTSDRGAVTINEGKLNVEINKNCDGYDMHINRIDSEYLYSGNLVLTKDNIYIYLRGDHHNERALITLKLPPVFYRKPKKEYIGGIGLIVSISTGNEAVPCMQKVLISDMCIPVEKCKDELINILSLEGNNFKIVRLDKEDEIIAYDFIKRYKNNDEYKIVKVSE